MLPTWAAGAHTPSNFPPFSPGHWQGAGLEKEQPELEPALKWNPAIAGRGFACFATVPAP